MLPMLTHLNAFDDMAPGAKSLRLPGNKLCRVWGKQCAGHVAGVDYE